MLRLDNLRPGGALRPSQTVANADAAPLQHFTQTNVKKQFAPHKSYCEHSFLRIQIRGLSYIGMGITLSHLSTLVCAGLLWTVLGGKQRTVSWEGQGV
jgi:hypothetical protein